jgi:hypothetical protein
MGPMMGMPPSSGLAIAALICGIAGVVLNGLCCAALGIPLAIAAAVMGGIQMSKCNAQPDQYGGKGMAMGGLICGIVGLLIGLAMIFLGFGMQMISALGQ